MKTNTHIVIKREDIFKYLTDEQIEYLDAILYTIEDCRKKDGKKPDNSYYICNTDEPYANEVLEVILKAESEEMIVVNNRLKDLSKRVEDIEKQIKEDKEEQLKKLKAELDYAKFRCALLTITDMMKENKK